MIGQDLGKLTAMRFRVLTSGIYTYLLTSSLMLHDLL